MNSITLSIATTASWWWGARFEHHIIYHRICGDLVQDQLRARGKNTLGYGRRVFAISMLKKKIKILLYIVLYYCGRPAIRWPTSSCDSRAQWTTSRVLRHEWILRRNNSGLQKYILLTTDNIIPYIYVLCTSNIVRILYYARNSSGIYIISIMCDYRGILL